MYDGSFCIVFYVHQKIERNISQLKNYATQLIVFYISTFRSIFFIPIIFVLILIMNLNVDNGVKNLKVHDFMIKCNGLVFKF
jgi:hypothetical protein